MTGFLGRLGAAFVGPEAAAVPRTEARAQPAVSDPRAIALLARPEDARPLGGAVALAAASAGPAVVAIWGGAPGAGLRAPATPAARRLSDALGRRGHAAHASGRLVVVALAGAGGEACAEAARVAAAAGDAPVVTVLAGPRDERVDAHLRAQERVVLAAQGESETLTGLALSSLAAGDIPACRLDVGTTPASRALAATGTALGGALRRTIEDALR